MTSRKVSIKMSRARSTIKLLKKTIGPTHNVSHEEDMYIEHLKSKNAKMHQRKRKWTVLGF